MQTTTAPTVGSDAGLGTLPDLTPFCSRDEARSSLQTPWNTNMHTYATDGRIMVRVAVRPEWPLQEDSLTYVLPATRELFKDFPDRADTRFVPLPDFGQVEWFVTCGECNGSGAVIEYEQGQKIPEICEDCEGEQRVPNMTRFRVGDRELAGHMIARLQMLPGVKVATAYGGPRTPLQFIFDGGEGVLMPLKPSA